MRTQTKVRLIRHGDASFEVRTSTWFYFDDHPGRRAISGHAAPEQAEAAAKSHARAERDRAASSRNDKNPPSGALLAKSSGSG